MLLIARILLVLAPIVAIASARGDNEKTMFDDANTETLNDRELGPYQRPYNDGQHPRPWWYEDQVHGGYHSSPGYQTPNQRYPPGANGPYTVPCSDELTSFTAEVFVDYNGDPALVTKRDVMFLERGFRQTYNALNKRLCDDKFREIHFVDAIAHDGGSPVIPRGGLSFGFRFLVKGVCRGCGPNANLFAPPLGYHRDLSSNDVEDESLSFEYKDNVNENEKDQHGRQLWQPHVEWDPWHPAPTQKKPYDPNYYGVRYYNTKGSKSSKTKGHKSSKGHEYSNGYKESKSGGYSGGHGGGHGGSACYCNFPNPLWRPPSEAAFQKAYNHYIVTFANDQGHKQPVDNTIEIVTDVVEIDGKHCAKNPSFFDTFLEIEFTGTGVTSSEIDIIESNVRAVYNGLSDKTCDSLFRDIESVSLVLDQSTDTTFTLLLLVDAECRDCPVDTTIFENTNQRQLAPFGRYRPRHRRRKNSECYCPTYEINSGAPTDNEFEVAFRDAVLELNAIGDLPNVEDVLNVQEITDGDGVTPAPTVAIPETPPPTARPTSSEDNGQGPSPSSSPSASPSSTPSSSPSTSPSSSPSTSPSSSPSTQPSTSPSTSPSTQPSSEPTTTGAPSNPFRPPSRSPSQSPTTSSAPSVSLEPSISLEPSLSLEPTTSAEPSQSPSVSLEPTTSAEPSQAPSLSLEPSQTPSLSLQPSTSTEPSLSPSLSLQPTTSSEPTQSPQPSSKPTNVQPTASIPVCSQQECSYRYTANVNASDATNLVDHEFDLGAVSFVRSIQVDLAHVFGYDLLIIVFSPVNDEYVLMEDTKAIEGPQRKNFDLGKEAGDPRLGNVAPYVFVESGASNAGFTAPYSLPGEYNAEKWETNGAPYAAGNWAIFIEDLADGDPGSIGDVLIQYCGVCDTGSAETSTSPSQSPSTSTAPTSSSAPSTQPSSSPSIQPSNGPTVTQDVTPKASGGRTRRGGNQLRH